MKGHAFLAPLLGALLLVSCAGGDSGGYPAGSGGGYIPPPEQPSRDRPPPTSPREWPPPSTPPVPVLQVNPAFLDFGSIEPGEAAELDLRLSNAGDGAASILSVSAAGRSLSLIADGCSERRLAPGRFCSLRVRFAPESAGVFSGTVFVVSDAPGGRRLEVAARGEGVRRHRSVPDIGIVPGKLDFGAVEVESARILELHIENRGAAELRLRAVAVAGSDFDLKSDGCGESLPARRACIVSVRFTPTRPGRVAGEIDLRSNDPDDPLLVVPLTGEGRARREPEIDVRPRQIDFGPIAVGKERLQEAKIFNRGARELRIRALIVDGPGFSVAEDPCSARPLQPGRECVVSVRFAPPASGSFEGRFGVASDDPDERRVAIPLSGKGREEERQGCPVVNLGQLPLVDQPAGPLVVTGVLPRGECLIYTLKVVRRGSVAACVPPGYSLTGGGVVLVKKKVCSFPDDPVVYRRYERRNVDAGSDIKNLKLTRGNDAPKEFKFLLEFRAPAGPRDAPTGDDD